jgi:hypothetical protein
MAKTAFEIASEYHRDGHVAGNVFVPEPLNVEKEVRRFQHDPLAPLFSKLDDSYSDMFQGDVGRYRYSFHFYSLSVERVLRHISIGRRWQSEVRYAHGGRRKFTDRQKDISRKYRDQRPFFELDFTNCLIHSRILMDRTIAFGRRFLSAPRLPSFTSFNDHKKFLKRDSNALGERHQPYVEYIVDNTEWFDVSLKPVRDKFAVHTAPNHIPFLGYSSDHDLEMCFVLDQRNKSKPFGEAQLVNVSIRRLARDVEGFLMWYNDYAIHAIGESAPAKPNGDNAK